MSDLNALVIEVLKDKACSEMKEKVDELQRENDILRGRNDLTIKVLRHCNEAGDIVHASCGFLKAIKAAGDEKYMIGFVEFVDKTPCPISDLMDCRISFLGGLENISLADVFLTARNFCLNPQGEGVYLELVCDEFSVFIDIVGQVLEFSGEIEFYDEIYRFPSFHELVHHHMSRDPNAVVYFEKVGRFVNNSDIVDRLVARIDGAGGHLEIHEV